MGPFISPRSVHCASPLIAVLTHMWLVSLVMYVSPMAALDGKAALLPTAPLTIMDVPSAPLGPTAPVSPLGPLRLTPLMAEPTLAVDRPASTAEMG